MHHALSQSRSEIVSATVPDRDLVLQHLNGADSFRPVHVNTHIHVPPNFSAFDSAEQAFAMAAEQGLSVLGVSNYYDFSIYRRVAELARRYNIFPIFGLEVIALDRSLRGNRVRVNDPSNPGRIYLCGKGITDFSPLPALANILLSGIRRNDRERMIEMAKKLVDFAVSRGFPSKCPGCLWHDSIIAKLVTRYRCARTSILLQERDVARAFQEEIFEVFSEETARRSFLEALYEAAPTAPVTDPVATQNELRSRLLKSGKPAFVEERFVTFDEARDLIQSLGGILCYPVLLDGANPICEFEINLEHLIDELRRCGVRMVEFIPARNQPNILESYAVVLRNAGFAVTAGTEHNTCELGPLTLACKDGAPIPPAVAEIFREGACVAVGHQYARLTGCSDGLVNCQGGPTFDSDPHLAFTAANRQLHELCSLGEAVLYAYAASAKSPQ